MISQELLSRVMAYEHQFSYQQECDSITLHIKNPNPKKWWDWKWKETYTMVLRFSRGSSTNDKGIMVFGMSGRCTAFLDLLQTTLMYSQPTTPDAN